MHADRRKQQGQCTEHTGERGHNPGRYSPRFKVVFQLRHVHD